MSRISKLALVAAGALLLTGCAGDTDPNGGKADTTSPSPVSSAEKLEAYKIGITQIVTHPALDSAVAGFKDGLAKAGFKNVTYDLQNAQGDMATASSIAKKFADEKLDLILGVATPTTQAVVKAEKTTPIVFTAVTDPVGAGLVKDAKAPEANVTGVSDMLPAEPTIALIKEVVPDIKKLGVLYNAGESNSEYQTTKTKEAAAAAGIEVVEATASNTAEVKAAADSLVGKVDAIAVSTDNTVVTALESVIKVANENKIPLFAGDTDSVERGALAAYSFNYKDLGEQAGTMAAAILSGTPVKDIPVQYAQKLQLAINEKAAAAMGVTLPQAVVDKAETKY
jgi:putative ABC transport system substrate-binding protein